MRDESWPFVVVTLENDLGQFGLLVFGLCDTEGGPAQIPNYGGFLDRIRIRIRTFGRGIANDELLQFQAWNVSETPFSSEAVDRRMRQFVELRALAASQLLNAPSNE